MTDIEKKQNILYILKQIDINEEFIEIVSEFIDMLNLNELLSAIKKYSDKLKLIDEKNNKIKTELDKMILKYQNNTFELSENIESLENIELLINNM